MEEFREYKGLNEPEIHSFDIEIIKLRTPFANEASYNREATSMSLDELTERIFLLKYNREQINEQHSETTHDITVSECLAFKIGEAGVGISAAIRSKWVERVTLVCFLRRRQRHDCCACILLGQQAVREVF